MLEIKCNKNNACNDLDSRIITEKTALASPVNTHQPRQQLCLVEGVAVPPKLLSTFQQAFVSDPCIRRPPFSYSRPLPPSVFKPGM